MFHPQSKNDPYFRKALYEVYRGRCAYCGVKLIPGNMQVDHILASKAELAKHPELKDYLAELEQEGFKPDQPDMIENYLPACAFDNRTKSNRTFIESSLRFYHGIARSHTKQCSSTWSSV